MEPCGSTVTRNPSEMGKLLKGLLGHRVAAADAPASVIAPTDAAGRPA